MKTTKREQVFKPLGDKRRVMKGLFSLLYDLLACHLKEPIKANLHLFVCTQNIHYFPPAELSGIYFANRWNDGMHIAIYCITTPLPTDAQGCISIGIAYLKIIIPHFHWIATGVCICNVCVDLKSMLSSRKNNWITKVYFFLYFSCQIELWSSEG